MHREQLWLVMDTQMEENKESSMDIAVGRWLMGIAVPKISGPRLGFPKLKVGGIYSGACLWKPQ